jgi:predicted MPP superfamily phosphohydrolase
MALALLALGAVGHVTLWVSLVSRFHALGVKRIWVDLLTILCGLMLVGMPVLIASAFPEVVGRWITLPQFIGPTAAWTYIVGCAGFSIVALLQRWLWHRHVERRGALLENHQIHVAMNELSEKPLTAPGISTWLSRLPGNQVLQLCVHERRLIIPRLPATSARLRIVHLSDLHMSGRVAKKYFEKVVATANECNADMIAVTGDIVEHTPCVDWIPDTLGKLRAPGGVYFVLGNHDKFADAARVREALVAAGLIYLGSRCIQHTIRDVPVLLAGNELPWFPPAADFRGCQARDASGLPLRILLAHSPDQFAWAAAHDVDLMLAGHVHGGQVCLPLIGPLMAPSWHGVRYAAGVFAAGKTVMHVSRGIGSLAPVRYNCPPEVAVLTLCAALCQRPGESDWPITAHARP